MTAKPTAARATAIFMVSSISVESVEVAADEVEIGVRGKGKREEKEGVKKRQREEGGKRYWEGEARGVNSLYWGDGMSERLGRSKDYENSEQVEELVHGE